MKKGWSVLLCLAMLLGISVVSAHAQTASGQANGMGLVSVELTVEDEAITAVSVNTDNETPGYGLELAPVFEQQILDAQSAEIDGVSGCTITSNAVRTATALALSDAGIAPESAEPAQSGVYIGTGRGARGNITVAVQVDGDQIQNIWPLDSVDSPVFSEMAIEAVAGQIVAKQSLAVDAYTGATLSSRGTVMAVEDALKQAGFATALLYAGEETQRTPAEDVEVDVLVVGGGTSGLVAALAADTNSMLGVEKSGLKVLVVERNSFAGGDLNFTGGFIGAPSGTVINEATGASVDPVTFGRAMLEGHPDLADKVNLNALDAIMAQSADVLNGLVARGFYMNAEDGAIATMDDFEYSYALTSEYTTGVRTLDDGNIYYNASPYEAESLRHLVADAGIEVRLNTEATGLIVEDNVCSGVTVQDREHTYNIYADKVILATGYGGFDEESIEMFYPEYEKVVPAHNSSNTSDAQKWIRELGGEVLFYPGGDYIITGINGVYGESTEYSTIYRERGMMWVNASAERFFNESLSASEGSIPTATRLYEGDGFAWLIFDATHEKGMRYIDRFKEQNLGYQADSIEELAQMIGVPADTLAETVAAYNQAAVSGTDEAFGAPADWMQPIEEGPFCAIKASPVSTASTALSVWVDDDMTVTLTQNGQRIENLLAAGGVCGYTVCPVIGYGTHVFEALVSGAYAGSSARIALTGK